jgi:hypothetical protein
MKTSISLLETMICVPLKGSAPQYNNQDPWTILFLEAHLKRLETSSAHLNQFFYPTGLSRSTFSSAKQLGMSHYFIHFMDYVEWIDLGESKNK